MDMRRLGGWALIGSAAMMTLGMAHHPHSFGSVLGPPVHAFMILALLITTYGFTNFAIDRGITQPLVLAGLIALSVGVLGGLGAAMVNGFIMPALASSGEPIGRDVYTLGWAANQALARLGVLATSGAILLWSVDLLVRAEPRARPVGALGLIAALVPAALLLAGLAQMNVTGAMFIYVTHALWGACVGVDLLVRQGQRSGDDLDSRRPLPPDKNL